MNDLPSAHPPDPVAQRIQLNWQQVRDQVRSATAAAGRPPDSVRIVGVSKYVDAQTTAWLVEAGCHDLGESRPQLLWKKADEMARGDAIRWHMIGHVQTNKIRRLLAYQPLIHSVDSQRVLQAIDTEAQQQGRVIDVLLEVNISGDPTKTGLSPDQLKQLVAGADRPGVRVAGLMAMAGWGTEQAEAAEQFQAVARLRDELQSASGVPLPELSMGMSGDYQAAIAAGATFVRIGSALFEGVR
ncbi:YggS family pyridoxal phosphate-dependent enzyme [Stieleria sp. TO1_6]|uniref:YggS family pyridoxal phosphate-dependent enzyme n=1 Tax=Stieleria tagensis TaxID=2956795 RepID=UPI00209AE166|nr:YggS family pyridoxal phosphate-dependent enzyme [Stieleria tagensis]MCO8122686.1 YggS family pyridoxal phosphate-dependent enzyme [Stieleria tagensis]